MTGDCHVRFCESRGAKSSLPLTILEWKTLSFDAVGGSSMGARAVSELLFTVLVRILRHECT